MGPREVTVRDEKVREPQLQRAYIAPSGGTAEPGEAEALNLLAEILGGGSTSRFYDKLVRGDGAATYAGANYRSNGLDSSRFIIYGLPKPGTDLRELEARMDEVIADLVQNGISEEELERAKRRRSRRRSTPSTTRRRSPTSWGRPSRSGRARGDTELAGPSAGGDPFRGAGGGEKYLRPETSATGHLEPLEGSRS